MGKKKKFIPTDQWPEEKIREEIDNAFARWEFIFQHGCQDPFYEDGINMNLVRNHIRCYYKILRERRENVQTSLFDEEELDGERPLPPEVPDTWMSPTGRYPDRLVNKRASEEG